MRVYSFPMSGARHIDPVPAAHFAEPVVRSVNPDGKAPLLLICDHASNAVPRDYDDLGLSPGELGRHIAYDIGAAWVTERLAWVLDAPALLHGASRLLIDPNRTLDDPTSITAISDGTVVPGNRMIAPEERQARAKRFFHPYHDTVAGALQRFTDSGTSPSVLAIHSYNPVYKGQVRPWEIGILWISENPLARGLIEQFSAGGVWTVGDNEPYDARNGHGYTIETHIEPSGLPNALVEFRNDLIATEAGAVEWADRLADALGPVLGLTARREGAIGSGQVA